MLNLFIGSTKYLYTLIGFANSFINISKNNIFKNSDFID